MPPTREIQGKYERTLTVERSAINQEARTVELALSSETPYERWYGIEILGHGPGEVDLSRLLNNAALLMDHNSRDQIGVIEAARLDEDRVLRCLVRFGRSARAEEIFQDVLDGIRSKVSVGYMTGDYEMTKGVNGGPDTYRFINWTPYEGSIVSVPADDTVGVGRSSEPTEALPPTPPASPAGTTRKVVTMPPEEIAAAEQAANTLRESIPGLLRTERSEALQLQAIAERMGLGSEAREILGGDKPLGEARQAILALVATKAAQPLPGPGVDMSEKEAKEYSYARAILNDTMRKEGTKVAHCFEDEIHETIARNLPANYVRKDGLLVPMQLRAGLDSGTTNAGAELKYTQFGGELIELLRNFTAVIKMGARVLPNLNGPVSFPKLTADAIAYWIAENGGADITASANTFGAVTLAAKILGGNTAFSRSLLIQSVISVESTVRESLAFAHAKAIDRAAIHGTGSSNQPTGIYRTSGVNTVAMGGVPTFGKLQDMITEVATDNALLGNLGFLTTPGLAGKLAQTLESSVAGANYIWTGNRQEGGVCGYKAMSTNQVAALMNSLVDTGGTSHGLLYGNWADVLIGYWGAMELITDPYSLKKQGMIEVATHQMADVAIRHPESFCVGTGAALS